MVELVIGMPVFAPGLLVFCFDWADSDCHSLEILEIEDAPANKADKGICTHLEVAAEIGSSLRRSSYNFITNMVPYAYPCWAGLAGKRC